MDEHEASKQLIGSLGIATGPGFGLTTVIGIAVAVITSVHFRFSLTGHAREQEINPLRLMRLAFAASLKDALEQHP